MQQDIPDCSCNRRLTRASYTQLAGLFQKEPFPTVKVDDESEGQEGITIRHDWKPKTSLDARYF